MSSRKEAEVHVPIIAGMHAPFRLVLVDGHDSWSPTLEEINTSIYDYVRLHRVSVYFDVGIAPFSMGICFDGTLVLPAIDDYRNPQAALAQFNTFLAELLMGGLYVEAMSPEDLCRGELTGTSFCRAFGSGRISNFHCGLRLKYGGALDSIQLLNPDTILVSELMETRSRGKERLASLAPVTVESILLGSTFFVRNLWAESLIHLWATTEQLLERMWADSVLCAHEVSGISRRRRKQFLTDSRTWTVSAKIEMFF